MPNLFAGALTNPNPAQSSVHTHLYFAVARQRPVRGSVVTFDFEPKLRAARTTNLGFALVALEPENSPQCRLEFTAPIRREGRWRRQVADLRREMHPIFLAISASH